MIRRLTIGVVLATIGLLLAPQSVQAALPRVLPICDQTVYLVPVNCQGSQCTRLTPEEYNKKYPTEKDKLQNPPKVTAEKACGFNDFVQLFVNLANWGLAILALLGTGFFVWGGFTLITSAGNQEKIKEGKSTLWGAVLGIAIVLTAWIFIGFVVAALTGSGPLLFSRDAEFTRRFSGQSCPEYEACGRNDLRYNEDTKKGCRDDARRNGNAVTDIQSKLRQLGCYDDSVDGCFGPETKNAVQQFQIKNLMVPFDGVVEQNTQRALDDAIAKANGRIGCVETPLTAEVSVDEAALTPDVVTIRVEGTVTWKNISGAVQTVIFQDAIQDGQPAPVFALNASQSKSLTFKNPGTYRYSKGPIIGRVVVTFF